MSNDKKSVQDLASQFEGGTPTAVATESSSGKWQSIQPSSRPNSFIKASPSENPSTSLSPLSNRRSIQDLSALQQEINPPIPFSLREGSLPFVKQKLLDGVVDSLTNFSLSYLAEGLKVKNGTTKEEMCIRMTDDMKFLEYLSLSPSASPLSINVNDIEEVKDDSSLKRVKIVYKGDSEPLLFDFEEKHSFLFAVDAMKSLIGFPLQSNEMRDLLNIITEVKALASLYPHPQRPSSPSNFSFCSNH